MGRFSQAAAVLFERSGDAPSRDAPSRDRMDVSPQEAESDDYRIRGRCLLADGSEHPIDVVAMSMTSFDMACPAAPDIGSIAVCYLEGIGIMAGQIVFKTIEGRFRVRPHVDASRRMTVGSRIEWHAEQETARLEQRAAPRIVPRRLRVTVKLGEQLAFKGTILNVSMTGAAIALHSTYCPFVGSVVQVGKRDAIVVRALKDGFAVHFKTPIRREVFDEDIVL